MLLLTVELRVFMVAESALSAFARVTASLEIAAVLLLTVEVNDVIEVRKTVSALVLSVTSWLSAACASAIAPSTDVLM